MAIPYNKSVLIKFDLLEQAVVNQGYSLNAIANKIGVSSQVFYSARKTHRINPAVLLEVCKYIDLDLSTIIKSDSQRKGGKIPKYKRVAINWEALNKAIHKQGYSVTSLAEAIGLSRGVFEQTSRDGKMNPAVLQEIRKYVHFDMNTILIEKKVERYSNGRSVDGRLGIDWLYLERCLKEKGISQKELSNALGKADGYLSGCKAVGGINEEVLIKIGELLDLDYHSLIKTTSYDRWNLRHEIVDMINDVSFDKK